MAKKLLQDMVVKTTKTSPRKIEVTRKWEREKKEIPPRRIEPENYYPVYRNKKSKYRIYFVAFIAVVFLLFALSFLFSGAKVTAIPKEDEISLNGNFSAVKDPNASDLSFDLVVISGEENKTIQGGGEMKETKIAAEGTVVIYNTFNTTIQKLDMDTRLEGSNGKIYKTKKAVTVPGTKDDKPGSIEVGIYAAGGGESYNSEPLDFKILGFKGTPKYEKFYARSKGNIVGGFSGKAPVVSSLDKTTAISELKPLLEAKLLKKVTDQVPNGFVLFKDAIFFSTDDKDATFTSGENNALVVNVKGTLYGFLLDEKKLTKKIAESIIDKYDGSEIYMPNISKLAFSLSDKENISFADVKNISFTLTGTPRIIWKVDEKKLITDMLGKEKESFNKILEQYPNIASAELVIRPFWKSIFPEKSKDIEIIVNYPK